MSAIRLVKSDPPLTPEQEAYVRDLIREETSRERTFLAALRRALLQIAGAIREERDT